MPSLGLDDASWKKSSRSNGNGGSNCVEVALVGDQVAVRNSRQPSGPVTFFTRTEWEAFVGGVNSAEFDLAALEAMRQS